MKKIKILTITITIILITMIAFFGIYIEKNNIMENIVKDYNYSSDISGTRTIVLTVDSAEDSAKTEENYLKTKTILENRLKDIGVGDYKIRLNEQNGDIIVEIPQDESTDPIVTNLATIGKFEIIDTDTKEVLMTNEDIKSAKALFGSVEKGTAVYLNIEFTEEGTKKYEDISNKYTHTHEDDETEENVEESTEEKTEEEKEKTITLNIDGQEIMSTSFEETIKTGVMQLSVGSATTDQETLQGNINQASNMAIVLDNGKLPVNYTVDENKYILSDITEEQIQIIEYIIMGAILIGLIVLIIRYKSNGILSAIAFIGLVSIFTLIIRYTNVVISIEGILGIAITLILNYIFVNKLLNKLKPECKSLTVSTIKKATAESYKEFFLNIIPICIMAVIFSFVKWIPISSFGMIMFWGISLIAIYNFVVTINLLKIKGSK